VARLASSGRSLSDTQSITSYLLGVISKLLRTHRYGKLLTEALYAVTAEIVLIISVASDANELARSSTAVAAASTN
jgi:hypothetical protein